MSSTSWRMSGEGGGLRNPPQIDFPFFKGITSKEISGMKAEGWVWVPSCGWDLLGTWRLPIRDAHGSASPFSDIQDRSIIKIYRKEPLYASFPASHITNGDLRVRGDGVSQGEPVVWVHPMAGTSKERKRWRQGLVIACVCGRSNDCDSSCPVPALLSVTLREWMFGA